MPKLIDVHTHVQFAAYEDKEKIIERALGEGTWLVNVGTEAGTSRAAVALANKYKEGVYATIGLHPIHTTESHHDEKELGVSGATEVSTHKGEEFDPDFYLELGREPKVLAIGECGLDYYRLDQETKEKQAEVFGQQIEVAGELRKPLMIHCRNAFGDLVKILQGYRGKLSGEVAGINHFFTGTKEDAKALTALGFYFSFGGVLTFTSDYDDVLRYIGLDRIVLETDAPYVAPVPHRGKRNEPAFVKYTAGRLAELLGESEEAIAAATTANARRVLKL